MDNMLRNCLPARFCAALSRAYSGSVIGRLQKKLSDSFSLSVTWRLCRAFLSAAPRAVYSRFYKFFSGVNAFLARVGAAFRPAAETSFILNALSSFSNSKLVSQSAILSGIKRLGMRGLLVAVFALYLPIDCFVRDVVGIDFLSAIWDEAFMLFCILYCAWCVCVSKTPVKPRITPLDAPLIFFCAVGILLVAVVSPKLGPAIDGYRAVIQFMLWFFVLTRLVNDRKSLRVLYFTFSAMAVAVALHGIYQYITCAPMPAAWVAKAEVGVRTRVYSITGSPNVMGALMVMAAPMLAGLAYYAKNLWVKWVMWGCTGIICLAALFTFSRGAWFGLTIAVIAFALMVDRKLLVFAAIGVLGVVFCVPTISNRIAFLFTSDFAQANSTGGRGERWEIGLSLWRTNPLFGFGLGRYGGAIAMQNRELENFAYYYMDNYYLKTLTEMGLIGLISYVWLLLKNLLWSVRAVFKTRKSRVSYLAAGIISGGLGVLAHSFFENIFEVPYMNAYFWGLAAAVMYIGFLRRRTA